MNDVTVLGEQERTSRGRVRCDYCGRAIAKGTRYYEQRCAAYRDIWTWRTCPVCADAWAHVEAWVDPDYHYDDPIGPDDYWEWAHEALGLVGVNAYDIRESGIDDRALALAADNPQAQAALRWVERTSPALHPDGITNYA